MIMGQYRKKPIVIEAWLVDELNRAAQRDWNTLPLCIQKAYDKGGFIFGVWVEERRGITVPTLEGSLFAGPDDWIIQGIQGEFYPCKDDIFKATYEPI
jgi:hypothetical protein